ELDRLTGECTVLAFELLFQLQHLAAKLVPLALQVVEPPLLLRRQRCARQQRADPLVDRLRPPQQVRLTLVLRFAQRPRGTAHDPAPQPPPRTSPPPPPARAGLPGPRRGQGEQRRRRPPCR